MQASDAIRWALIFTDQGFTNIVSDMREAALTPSTPGAKGGDGNHTLWCIGHQAFIEASVHQAITGKPNALGHWGDLFAPGTRPKPDASAYPPFDEVLSTYRSMRRRSLALLDEIGPDGLDHKPVAVPPGFEDAMTTNGGTLLLCTLHQMVHYGQVADARRVAGRKPLF